MRIRTEDFKPDPPRSITFLRAQQFVPELEADPGGISEVAGNPMMIKGKCEGRTAARVRTLEGSEVEVSILTVMHTIEVFKSK